MPTIEGDEGAIQMSGDLLTTIESVHAAALDAQLWPQALAAVAATLRGATATIEAIDRETLCHREFLCHGLPPAGEIEYVEQYAAINPRIRAHRNAKLGEVTHDYAILDEDAMRRNPFYAEFLPRLGVRYFIAGIVASSPEEFVGLIVHRPLRHEHFDRADIATMKLLIPHVQQAFDVTRRLRTAGDTRDCLERALDWLAEGVALVRADGAVVYANHRFEEIVRRGDGLRLRKREIEFATPQARDRFGSALAAAARLKNGTVASAGAIDFVAAGSASSTPYVVSVRPLASTGRDAARGAVAAVFVRDRQAHSAAAITTLREIFGLTEAEASLAQALQSGMTLAAYAESRRLSANTVYTHLRRVREKTGCSRMPELIRKLNGLQVPLRAD
jgi:DNA-binding CsgD family transcriptional regulator/PAS domain-containing protein